jgi:hypothetical protein
MVGFWFRTCVNRRDPAVRLGRATTSGRDVRIDVCGTGIWWFKAILPVVAARAALNGSVPRAAADAVAYLVNVTLAPGYGFANAEQSLAYGRDICEKIAAGYTYGRILEAIGADIPATDDYRASFLATQAANELCPTLIWQLRQSAAGYCLPAS